MSAVQTLPPAIDEPVSDRPLRIALVNAADRGGGAEASTLSLHLALKKLGHESRLYVGTKLTTHADVYEIPRFRCLPGVLRGAQWLEQKFGWQYLYHPWFRRLDRLFHDEIDVIHFQTLWSGRLGYADVGGLPKLTRRFPSIMTLRDLWMVTGHCACPALGCERWKTGCGQCPDLKLAPGIEADGTAFNWRRKRRALAASRVRITTVSNWLGDVVHASPIFRGKEVHTVYNGIDETAFHPRPRAAVRARLGLPQDAFIVMLAGQSVKGTARIGNGAVEYALNALTECRPEPFALVVGKSAQSVLHAYGKAGRAVPFQTDPAALAEYYCAADVVLVASLWETFGRIPAEAQMCGIPVVGFATGGIPEVVQHGVTGLLAERQDAAGLSSALTRLANESQRRNAMGRAGAERARAMFADSAVASNYVEHYRSEIAARQAAGLRKGHLV
jgi:glycosyltransferase involved in cell wall biosynthesis